jgi:hypothetical protein
MAHLGLIAPSYSHKTHMKQYMLTPLGEEVGVELRTTLRTWMALETRWYLTISRLVDKQMFLVR